MNPTKEPIVEHAGSGFALPESIARRIDELADGLPKDFTYRRLSANPSEFSIEEGERTDVSFITTDAVDRDGEVVLPGGGDWKNYNRVVTFAHDYKGLPVGSNWWIRPKMKGQYSGLIAKTHYPARPKDWEGPWMPSAVLHLMQQAVPTCTGKSIGFIPLNIRPATAEEKAKRPELKDTPIIDKWVGLEYAVAPVPCNDTSEMVAVSKTLKAFADRAAAAVIAKAFGIKDMADGDGDDMPPCPKCMSAEHVSRKGESPDIYTCAMCKCDFMPNTGKTLAEQAAELRERKIAEALGGPFITADDYLANRRRAASEQAKQYAEAYLTMRSGKV